MDEAGLKEWRRLRTRVLQGETLNATERARYEAGRAELDAAEQINSSYIQEIRAALDHIAEYEQERIHLREERTALETRLAALEARLTARTKIASGVREG